MKHLAWFVNRLRVMSAGEVIFRMQRAVVQLFERCRVATGWYPVPSVPVKTGLSLFGNDPQLAHHWKERFSLDQARLESCMAGRISFFGHKPLDVGSPVNWHRDPVTGIESPRKFGKSLNYRDDRLVGNVKFLWELGRHQHLVPLAVAYVTSGDTRYRDAAIGQIEDWIEQNPYTYGIHWCSALEVSLRLISWALIHSVLVLRDGEEGLFAHVEQKERVGKSIYQQAFFVRHFLSRYSSANNHLIGELCGLWAACTVFDLGDAGRQWATFAHEELERESRQQIHEDGVNKEQAFYYHLWVLDYFLFAWLVACRAGRPFSETFTTTILKMARFLEDVSPEGGEPPQIGDSDDGFVARFEPQWPVHPYCEMRDTIHAVFTDINTSESEKAFWYRAMAGPVATDRPDYRWTRTYPVIYRQGGYVVMGGGGCHLVFDTGPLGYLGIAAHGHADALSLCLAVDGEWWLVDPGTYAYHSDPDWRTYFRGTSAHNTLRLNQTDQSQMAGPFMWLEKASAWIDEIDNDYDNQYVKSWHNGYRADGLTHARAVRFRPGEHVVELTDRIEGAEARAVEMYFHFAPDIHVEWNSSRKCWTACRPRCNRHMLIYPDQDWEFASYRGSTDPILGWYSPALEEKVPATTLRGTTLPSGSLQAVTRIMITGA